MLWLGILLFISKSILCALECKQIYPRNIVHPRLPKHIFPFLVQHFKQLINQSLSHYLLLGDAGCLWWGGERDLLFMSLVGTTSGTLPLRMQLRSSLSWSNTLSWDNHCIINSFTLTWCRNSITRSAGEYGKLSLISSHRTNHQTQYRILQQYNVYNSNFHTKFLYAV